MSPTYVQFCNPVAFESRLEWSPCYLLGVKVTFERRFGLSFQCHVILCSNSALESRDAFSLCPRLSGNTREKKTAYKGAHFFKRWGFVARVQSADERVPLEFLLRIVQEFARQSKRNTIGNFDPRRSNDARIASRKDAISNVQVLAMNQMS